MRPLIYSIGRTGTFTQRIFTLDQFQSTAWPLALQNDLVSMNLTLLPIFLMLDLDQTSTQFDSKNTTSAID